MVVYGSMDEVRDELSAAIRAQAARFQPVQFDGEDRPEVIALHMDDVLMLASADSE